MLGALKGFLGSFGEPADTGDGLHPDDADLDPIRAAVRSGRGLVVDTDGRLYPRVVEALRVCGRMADLRVAHAASESMDESTLGRWSRRLPREGFPGMAVPEAPVGNPPDARNGAGVVPELALDEATEPGRVVVFVGAGRLRKSLSGYVYAAAVSRSSGGDGGPAYVSDAGPPDPWDGGWTELRMPEGPSLACIGPWSSGGGEDGARRLRQAWRDALRAYDAGCAIVERGSEAWGSRDGRFVLVRHGASPKDGAGSYEITEVPDLGPPRVLVLAGQHLDRDRTRRLVALALRGGIDRVADGRFPGRRHPERTFNGSSVARGGMPDGMTDGIAQALGRIDVDLARAMPYRRNRALVHRIVADCPPSVGRRRREFVLTWPGCCDALLEPWVRHGVDHGQESVPLVARWLGAGDAAARRLVGVPALRESLGTVLTRNLPGLGAILSRLGHGHLPPAGDLRQWQGLVGTFLLVEGLLTRLRIVGFPVERAVALAIRVPGRDWNERFAALTSGAHRLDAGLVGDAVDAARAWLTGITGDGVSPEAAMLLLAGPNGGLAALARAERAWHDDRRLSGRGDPFESDEGWAVPFGTVDLGAGWSARALSTPAELRAEGASGIDGDGAEGLDHCVGGYAHACRGGSSLVLSLRRMTDGGIRRVSTVELVRGDGDWTIAGRRFQLGQHRSRRNAAPSAEAVDRLGILRTMLAEGRVAIGAEPFASRPTVADDLPERHEARRRAARQAATELLPTWRRILPAPYRGMEVEALVRAVAEVDRELLLLGQAQEATLQIEGT